MHRMMDVGILCVPDRKDHTPNLRHLPPVMTAPGVEFLLQFPALLRVPRVESSAQEKVLAAMAMRDAVVIQQSAPKRKAPMGKLTGSRQKITKAKIVSVPSVRPPR